MVLLVNFVIQPRGMDQQPALLDKIADLESKLQKAEARILELEQKEQGEEILNDFSDLALLFVFYEVFPLAKKHGVGESLIEIYNYVADLRAGLKENYTSEAAFVRRTGFLKARDIEIEPVLQLVQNRVHNRPTNDLRAIPDQKSFIEKMTLAMPRLEEEANKNPVWVEHAGVAKEMLAVLEDFKNHKRFNYYSIVNPQPTSL